MKTIRFVIMALAFGMLGVGLSSCVLNVENTAGNLESIMGKAKNVSTLRISGPLNGDDILYLREILTSELCRVSTLDLSNASIVDGGRMAYITYHSYKKIKIFTSEEKIGNYMFCGCKFRTVILPNTITSIGDSAFSGCTSLKEIDIPDSVTSIGSSAFSGCTSLTEVTIGNNVTLIGSYAFSRCTSLKEIDIPDSVTSIDYVFGGCTSLYTLIIGDGVTSIGDSAFDECDRLYEFYCYATTPPRIGSETFTNPNTFLYVPKGSLEAYKVAWDQYFKNIFEMK